VRAEALSWPSASLSGNPGILESAPPGIEERRFANPGLAGDESNLPLTVLRRLCQRLQPPQLIFAADDRRCRSGGGGLGSDRIAAFLDLGDEDIAALGVGANVDRLVGAVAQRPAQLEHVRAQNLRLDECIRPEGIEQFVVRDEAAGMLDEVAQHGKGPGCEGDLLASPPQTLIRRIEPKRPKLQHAPVTSPNVGLGY
jgi:hypothetical protein